MKHRFKTIAIAATASALTVAGMAVASGDRHWGGWPWGSAGKSLTYSETHLQRGGDDVTLRVDQGRVTAASADSISIQRNDGETVAVPVDEDTKVWGGWWRHKHDVSASHDKGHDDDDDDFGVADIPAGKRVLVLRSDDDEAAEAIKLTGWKHGHGHHRGHDHDDDRD